MPDDSIKSEISTPIPVQVRARLLKEIREGSFAAGRRIPSERKLAERFKVSRSSIRESIADLINSGILFRSAGKGTFVSETVQAPRTDRETRAVAFLISDQIFHFIESGYNRILAGVEGMCRKRGRRLLFHSVVEDESEHLPLRLLGNGQPALDGCVVAGGIRHATLQRLQDSGIPVVLVDLLIADDAPDIVSVRIDYETGTHLAMEHLYELGHREIGFVGFSGSEKYRAYWQSLEKHGQAYNPRFVEFLRTFDLEPGILAGYHAMQRLIAHGSLPSALLVTNDLVAIGVMEALGVAGIQVPQQISIVGFDDIGRKTSPPLTTIRADLVAAGRLAAKALLDKIEGKGAQRLPMTVPVKLLVRGSTAGVGAALAGPPVSI